MIALPFVGFNLCCVGALLVHPHILFFAHLYVSPMFDFCRFWCITLSRSPKATARRWPPVGYYASDSDSDKNNRSGKNIFMSDEEYGSSDSDPDMLASNNTSGKSNGGDQFLADKKKIRRRGRRGSGGRSFGFALSENLDDSDDEASGEGVGGGRERRAYFEELLSEASNQAMPPLGDDVIGDEDVDNGEHGVNMRSRQGTGGGSGDADGGRIEAGHLVSPEDNHVKSESGVMENENEGNGGLNKSIYEEAGDAARPGALVEASSPRVPPIVDEGLRSTQDAAQQPETSEILKSDEKPVPKEEPTPKEEAAPRLFSLLNVSRGNNDDAVEPHQVKQEAAEGLEAGVNNEDGSLMKKDVAPGGGPCAVGEEIGMKPEGAVGAMVDDGEDDEGEMLEDQCFSDDDLL